MAKVETVESVGIDIGTTTMSIVVSHLRIENRASGLLIPQIRIIDKEIAYRSEVMLTPYRDATTIDFEEIEQRVLREYLQARIDPADIRTGAVIITGEAARKKNAEMVSQTVSRMSGSFVVATAGAHLEASISGLGSGAAQYSREHHARIANLDIGGGTTNASVYDCGSLAGTFCSDIGGRVIRFRHGTNEVADFTRSGAITASECGIVLRKGICLDNRQITDISDALAESLISVLREDADVLSEKLSIGPLPSFEMSLDAVALSGGVGRLFYERDFPVFLPLEEVLRYDDIGIALARSLQMRRPDMGAQNVRLQETIYATVIGAGVHTTDLSGSTIYISDPEILPLRDLPVVRYESPENGRRSQEDLLAKLRAFCDGHSVLPAIVLERMEDMSFDTLKGVAFKLCEVIERTETSGPLVVICENDIGKFMGGVLKNRIGKTRPIVSIDQVAARELDYIDIGKPLYGGSVVPVAVKTLVFSE